MDVPISDAASRLAELIRKAERGEEVVLTDHGVPVAKLAAVIERPQYLVDVLPPDLARRRERLLALSSKMAIEKVPGADAAHASDFLFDEYGLPG